MHFKSLTIHCLRALQEPPRFPQLPSTAFISPAPSQRSLQTPSPPRSPSTQACNLHAGTSAQRGSNFQKSAVMGRFWTWVLLILVVAVHAQVQNLALPQMVSASTPPIRHPSPLAGTGTGAAKPPTPRKLQQTTTYDDPRLSLEDYKPVDPSPDSGTSKVKSSPIEHGELLNPYITPKPPSSDIDHQQPSPAPSLTKTLET